MKAIRDLSKDELISIIYNNCKDYSGNDINTFDELAQCAQCGTVKNAKYSYICDECEKSKEIK